MLVTGLIGICMIINAAKSEGQKTGGQEGKLVKEAKQLGSQAAKLESVIADEVPQSKKIAQQVREDRQPQTDNDLFAYSPIRLFADTNTSTKIKGLITITTEYKDKNLIVKIKDNGKGIPKDQLNKIFTAGFTTKSSGIGTGLGLAICTKIIEKHEGKITVNSELGKGSEFVITISGK